MKTIKILTFIIVGILVVGLGLGAYVYFCTDTFKTNKEIFYKYAKEEQVLKFFDFDMLEQTLAKFESEKSRLNMDVNINAFIGEEQILNNNTIFLESKINPIENETEINLTIGNANNNDILEMNGIYNKEKVGISFKDITKKYMVVENNNSDEFLGKIGIDMLNLDEIDFSQNNIAEKLEKMKTEGKECLEKIAEEVPKENYFNLGKTQIEVNGTNVEAKAYELRLSNEEIKQIYSSINNENEIAEFLKDTEYDFSQVIYVYEENVVKIETTIKDENSTDIQIINTIEDQNDNLTIKIDNPDEMQIQIGITKISKSDKYKVEIILEAEETEIIVEINVNVEFNNNIKITQLTNENEVVLNDKSAEEIEEVMQILVSKIKEQQGIEDTIIGTIYNFYSTLFNSARTSTENIEKQLEKEKSLSNEMVEVNGQMINIRDLD